MDGRVISTPFIRKAKRTGTRRRTAFFPQCLSHGPALSSPDKYLGALTVKILKPSAGIPRRLPESAEFFLFFYFFRFSPMKAPWSLHRDSEDMGKIWGF
jgi:hypothetical protein